MRATTWKARQYGMATRFIELAGHRYRPFRQRSDLVIKRLAGNGRAVQFVRFFRHPLHDLLASHIEVGDNVTLLLKRSQVFTGLGNF